MRRAVLGGEKGVALLLAMVVTAILAAFTVSILAQATGKFARTDARMAESELLQAAEAGLDAGILELNGHTDDATAPEPDHDGRIGTGDWAPGDDSIVAGADPDRLVNGIPNFGEAGVVPVRWGNVEYYTWAEYFCEDGRDNDNDGMIDSLDDPEEAHYVRLLAFARQLSGRHAERRQAVYEAVLKSRGAMRDHDFFCFPYAIGSCNQLGIPFVLDFGGQTGASYWQCRRCGFQMSSRRDCPQCGASSRWVRRVDIEPGHADSVIGDIFHDGDMKWTQNAQAEGRVQATGRITGNPGPGAEVIEGAEPVEASDLAGMNYGSLADYVVDESTPLIRRRVNTGYSSSVETPPLDDPRHIFVRNYRSDLGELAENRHANGAGGPVTQWMLADAWEGNSLGNISLHPAEGTDKVYYVKGDLWLETGAYHSMFVDDPPEGSRATVIVEGNIYVCDDFWVTEGSSSPGAGPPAMTDDCRNGIAFIAVTGGRETFTDMNGNWMWDPGEPILNDDGDGTYEGPRYGCGNITYGDPNTGPVGHTQAFFYAENNFKDYCLDQNGQPLDFGITGLMSAGGLLDINRDFGNRHAQMTVVTDSRLHRKLLSLPGLPSAFAAGSLYPVGPFQVISWRRLR